VIRNVDPDLWVIGRLSRRDRRIVQGVIDRAGLTLAEVSEVRQVGRSWRVEYLHLVDGRPVLTATLDDVVRKCRRVGVRHV
jgi:hypothetical protein